MDLDHEAIDYKNIIIVGRGKSGTKNKNRLSRLIEMFNAKTKASRTYLIICCIPLSERLIFRFHNLSVKKKKKLFFTWGKSGRVG